MFCSDLDLDQRILKIFPPKLCKIMTMQILSELAQRELPFNNMPIVFWVMLYVKSLIGSVKKCVACQHLDR
jgi:hypothetical protein